MAILYIPIIIKYCIKIIIAIFDCISKMFLYNDTTSSQKWFKVSQIIHKNDALFYDFKPKTVSSNQMTKPSINQSIIRSSNEISNQSQHKLERMSATSAPMSYSQSISNGKNNNVSGQIIQNNSKKYSKTITTTKEVNVKTAYL